MCRGVDDSWWSFNEVLTMSTQMKAPGPTTQQLLLENASFERKILQEILRTLLCFMGLTQIIKYIVF